MYLDDWCVWSEKILEAFIWEPSGYLQYFLLSKPTTTRMGPRPACVFDPISVSVSTFVDWLVRRSNGTSSPLRAGPHTSTCIDRTVAIRQPRGEIYLLLSRVDFLETGRQPGCATLKPPGLDERQGIDKPAMCQFNFGPALYPSLIIITNRSYKNGTDYSADYRPGPAPL